MHAPQSRSRFGLTRLLPLAAAVHLCASCGGATPPQVQPAAAEPSELCPHAEGEDAKLFAWEAFGPAAMSFGLLGQAWWQWDAEGHAFEQDGGTIWVVVHDGLSDEALASRFPVRPNANCDHRYVALPSARTYLRTHIDELADPDVAEFAAVRARLEQTLEAVNQLQGAKQRVGD